MNNRYGLDVDYFNVELRKLKNSLDDRTPDEVWRYLIRLANLIERDKKEESPVLKMLIKEIMNDYVWHSKNNCNKVYFKFTHYDFEDSLFGFFLNDKKQTMLWFTKKQLAEDFEYKKLEEL